jgi:hypothetical protein
VKLTICFYENPAAKQELVFWEGLVKDKIQSKSYINDIWSYHLKDDEENELVVCIPIDRTKEFRGISEVSKIADNEFDLHKAAGKLKYYKTLIFGKVEEDQLKFISTMISLMSRGKWN